MDHKVTSGLAVNGGASWQQHLLESWSSLQFELVFGKVNTFSHLITASLNRIHF